MNLDRIAEYGEVFTNEKEVKDMLALVQNEIQRIDSKFLDPACGDGNFLKEVILQKLILLKQINKKEQLNYEKNLFLIVANTYGIELLEDNVIKCRKRIHKIVSEIYLKKFKNNFNTQFITSLNFVISKNIVHGDSLTNKNPSNGEYLKFSEWVFTTRSLVKRREFLYKELIENSIINDSPLFAINESEVFIPEPYKDFKAIHFYELASHV